MARLAAAEVLSGLYEAIADPTQFDSMLQAMDDFLDSNPDGLETSQADWKGMFRQHFSRAGQFLDVDDGGEQDTPIVFVDRQVVPAAVLDRRQDILAANELFSSLIGNNVNALKDRCSTPEDARRFSDLFRANESQPAVLISFTLAELQTPLFVVAAQAPALELPGQTGPFVTIKVAKATWNPDLKPLLETAYNLTLAEIEVLEGLIDTGSVASVAERRQRSVRTVRTQLTAIFDKLGLTSQTELALFLATLSQLMTKQKRPSDVSRDWLDQASGKLEHCTLAHNGHTLAYVKYGDPSGAPVMLIHSTTPPEMIPAFREACRAGGLFVIGVHKPGSGGASPRPADDGPEAMAGAYAAILDEEGWERAIIAGHCSGGLYALAFAATYPQRTRGVMLVDTGVPFKGRRELMRLPKALRRTFLPARYIPEVLLVPHRIFAANFKRSSAGEARVVDYFFEDNPVDQNLTRTDRLYYEITRQMIAYSFEDVDRLVGDVRRWARDWSWLFNKLGEKPLHFLHGSENRLFQPDRIADHCADTAYANLHLSEGMGQLHIYQNPSLFADVAKEIAAETLSET